MNNPIETSVIDGSLENYLKLKRVAEPILGYKHQGSFTKKGGTDSHVCEFTLPEMKAGTIFKVDFHASAQQSKFYYKIDAVYTDNEKNEAVPSILNPEQIIKHIAGNSKDFEFFRWQAISTQSIFEVSRSSTMKVSVCIRALDFKRFEAEVRNLSLVATVIGIRS